MKTRIITALGVAAGIGGLAGPAVAAPVHRHFSETEAGTQLSTTGDRFEDLFRVKTSSFGAGTVIRDVTLSRTAFPATGRATATSYYRDGRLIANETLTFGVPAFDGVGSVSGTGTCRGGSEAHANETCTYTVKGSYDLVTGRTYLTLAGTYTPSTKKG